ncbi:MAG: hypothetical protein J4F28_09265 [Nitrosopumilaceae archaeon]|nr:hypothetical protein [Nitrosopumilaceae archaeon]
MNPIIVIGLVSVVTAAYDGLEKQAALAALHADMLARQHAAHTTYVSGVIEEKQHVIISNNGPQPAELIQVRAYDDASALLNTWEMSYELQALQDFNMSSATMPTPPSALTGSALETSLDNGDYYRGVTSAGSLFEIVLASSSGTETPDGTYGPVSSMPLTGGGTPTTHVGRTIYSYHFADSAGTYCNESRGVYPYSKWTTHDVYDAPFYTGFSLGYTTPVPSGTASWNFWLEERPYPRIASWPLCSGGTPSPSDLTLERELPSGELVVKRPLVLANYNVNLARSVAGTFTMPSDGDVMLRVEVPVTATTTAHYDGAHTSTGTDRNCRPANHDGYDYLTPIQQRAINQWETGLGASALTAAIDAERNGSPAGSFDMSDIRPVGDTSANVQFSTVNVQASGGRWTCDVVLNGQLDGSWSHTGVLVGLLEFQASEGDVIDVDGTVRLRYTPPSVSGAAVDNTYARLELGDTAVSIGIKPP